MKQSRADIPGMQRQDPRAERLALPRVAVETSAFTLSTAQFGQMNGVKDQTVRWRLCMTGSYFGTQPRKLVNGRLAWPSVRIGNQ